MMRLFILFILTIHTDSATQDQNNRAKPQEQVVMTDYPNSIDDEFEGCKEDMYKQVTKKLLKNELNSNGNFRADWNKAKKGLFLQKILDSRLTKDALRKIAIRAYTGDAIHRDLNDKMREGRETYKTRFGLISLHFLITDGIQTRNAEQRRQRDCWTTYRRTNITTEITGHSVRFGGFASSSFFPDKRHFGTQTCFIITTRYGADISSISAYSDSEGEVLIPPYEVFKNEPVTEIPEDFKECKRVYTLRSVGKVSNMNCEYLKKDKMG
ncbi:hypothetical protein SRHO_G00076840 [Serrasalmus rhombeus]